MTVIIAAHHQGDKTDYCQAQDLISVSINESDAIGNLADLHQSRCRRSVENLLLELLRLALQAMLEPSLAQRTDAHFHAFDLHPIHRVELKRLGQVDQVPAYAARAHA